MNKIITIYELLGMIKDKKAPKKIKYCGHIWKFCNNGAYSSYWFNDIELQDYLDGNILENLNDTVEILGEKEEKKIPEKLDIELNSGDENKVNYYRATNLECELAFKINSIIDYLKSKGDE